MHALIHVCCCLCTTPPSNLQDDEVRITATTTVPAVVHLLMAKFEVSRRHAVTACRFWRAHVRLIGSIALTSLQNDKLKKVVIAAAGQAVPVAVSSAEAIRRRVPGLHQITEAEMEDFSQTFIARPTVPAERKLQPIVKTKRVPTIHITLSTEPLDSSAVGYQPPLPPSEVDTSAKPTQFYWKVHPQHGHVRHPVLDGRGGGHQQRGGQRGGLAARGRGGYNARGGGGAQWQGSRPASHNDGQASGNASSSSSAAGGGGNGNRSPGYSFDSTGPVGAGAGPAMMAMAMQQPSQPQGYGQQMSQDQAAAAQFYSAAMANPMMQQMMIAQMAQQMAAMTLAQATGGQAGLGGQMSPTSAAAAAAGMGAYAGGMQMPFYSPAAQYSPGFPSPPAQPQQQQQQQFAYPSHMQFQGGAGSGQIMMMPIQAQQQQPMYGVGGYPQQQSQPMQMQQQYYGQMQQQPEQMHMAGQQLLVQQQGAAAAASGSSHGHGEVGSAVPGQQQPQSHVPLQSSPQSSNGQR